MTLPHQFSQYELEQIAIGSAIYKKDWKQIQLNMLPYLNPTSIKNKYYKMAKSGLLAKLLSQAETNASISPLQCSPPSYLDETSASEELVLQSLYKLALSQAKSI